MCQAQERSSLGSIARLANGEETNSAALSSPVLWVMFHALLMTRHVSNNRNRLPANVHCARHKHAFPCARVLLTCPVLCQLASYYAGANNLPCALRCLSAAKAVLETEVSASAPEQAEAKKAAAANISVATARM